MVWNENNLLRSQKTELNRRKSFLLTPKKNTTAQYLQHIYYRIQPINHYANVRQTISRDFVRPQRLSSTFVPGERITDA